MKSFFQERGIMSDGIGHLDESLRVRGLRMGGDGAEENVTAPEGTRSGYGEQVRDFLTYGHNTADLAGGFFLTSITPSELPEANAMLAGHIILRPRGSALDLAVVSPEGLQTPSRMKLTTLLNQGSVPFTGVSADQHLHLSTAAQAETLGIGLHPNERSDPNKNAVDPEHLLALYSVSRHTGATKVWEQAKPDQHINHTIRRFGSIPNYAAQTGIYDGLTIPEALIPKMETDVFLTAESRGEPEKLLRQGGGLSEVPHIKIMWHEEMVDADGVPLCGDFSLDIGGEQYNALQIVLGMGYESLSRTTHKTAWATTQRLIDSI